MIIVSMHADLVATNPATSEKRKGKTSESKGSGEIGRLGQRCQPERLFSHDILVSRSNQSEFSPPIESPQPHLGGFWSSQGQSATLVVEYVSEAVL